jgi:predicted PurR-regulated permease PerM
MNELESIIIGIILGVALAVMAIVTLRRSEKDEDWYDQDGK